MKLVLTYLALVLLFMSCSKTVETQFNDAVLEEQYTDLNGNQVKFAELLSAHKDKQIVLDIWASWCRDCIVELPELRALQDEKPDAIYLFLSADRTLETWKRAIEKYNLKGDHYFMPNGTKGLLGDFVDIDWIPRYMIVNSEGQIELFEAIEADDPLLKETLK